jgi:hypothetical protein
MPRVPSLLRISALSLVSAKNDREFYSLVADRIELFWILNGRIPSQFLGVLERKEFLVFAHWSLRKMKEYNKGSPRPPLTGKDQRLRKHRK